VWIDTGGTFTDGLAVDPHGRLRRTKVLSSSALRATVAAVEGTAIVLAEPPWELPAGFFTGFACALLGDPESRRVLGWERRQRRLTLERPLPRPARPGDGVELRSPEEAPVLAARLLTGTPIGRPLPPTAMRLATTRGTNALLERRGAPTALFVTAGFGDLLRIGTQQRAELFALRPIKPEPLVAAVVEVGERLDARGGVVEPLDEARLRRDAAAVLAGGVDVAAVALLHAYRDPRHEHRVAAVLREEGFRYVSTSAELAPLIRLLPRAETAVVDATLAPVISGYVARVAEALAGGSLHVMTSAGGLVRAAGFRPKDSLLSGPAGGVVGMVAAGRRSGFTRVIGFDMGGTSTDVARCDGEVEYVFEHRVGDATLVAPALAVESVAAGGGSVCRWDGQRLFVGPESAGADPGPACYGNGGPLTVTDVNLALGRLDPARFGIPIDLEAAARAVGELTVAVRAVSGADAAEAVLEGLLEIADERMADAIRRISLRRGFDPAGYALVAFGGAGGQHACAVARLLGIGTVLVPADAGLLSAVGLGRAVIERFAERQVLAPLDELGDGLEEIFGELTGVARDAVAAEGVDPGEVVVRRRIANLRFAGQDSSLAVEVGIGADAGRAFRRAYRRLYGYLPAARVVEVESLRVVASSRPARERRRPAPRARRRAQVRGEQRCWVGGGWRRVPLLAREDLRPGDRAVGPALVSEAHAATFLPPGWRLTVDGARALVLTAVGEDDGA